MRTDYRGIVRPYCVYMGTDFGVMGADVYIRWGKFGGVGDSV